MFFAVYPSDHATVSVVPTDLQDAIASVAHVTSDLENQLDVTDVLVLEPRERAALVNHMSDVLVARQMLQYNHIKGKRKA